MSAIAADVVVVESPIGHQDRATPGWVANGRPRVLLVDDDPELLATMPTELRRFEISTARSSDDLVGLPGPDRGEPFAAIVCDMQALRPDGATTQTWVDDQGPGIPVVVLTGETDVQAVVDSINDTRITRVLTKPCPPELLSEAIDEAIHRAKLENVERELLDRTLSGTVDLLIDILGLVRPQAVSRAHRITGYVRRICHALNHPVSWELDLAAMLSQVGFVVLPPDAILDVADLEVATLEERRVELAAELLMRIPRMESVAALIRGQTASEPVRLDDDQAVWACRELNAEILRLAVRFEDLSTAGRSPEEAFAEIMFDAVPPPGFLLEAAGVLQAADEGLVAVSVPIRNLEPGMVLAADLLLETGPKLAPEGMELTAALIGRVQSFARTPGVREPVEVLVPAPVALRLGVPSS